MVLAADIFCSELLYQLQMCSCFVAWVPHPQACSAEVLGEAQPHGSGGGQNVFAMVEIPTVNPTACFNSRTFAPNTLVTVAGVDRSLCFGRDSQIKAYVLLRQAITYIGVFLIL